MSKDSIIISDLAIGYAGRMVQRHLSLSLPAGELIVLLGPNGVGKSTLLRTLAGLQPALEGHTNLTSLNPEQLSKRLALVLTENTAAAQTTVHDIVAMGRYPYTSFLGGLSSQDEQHICQALDKVGMSDYAVRMFNALSDGEKQRVLIAKAIAQQTDIMLLDEPTAHLDLPSRIRMFRLLGQLAHEQGKTILVSTHELDLALRLSDRVLLMANNGLTLGTAESLRKQDAFTPAFGMDVFAEL